MFLWYWPRPKYFCGVENSTEQNLSETEMPLNCLIFTVECYSTILMNSGTNFGHFAWTAGNEMKPRGILCYKGPYFRVDLIPLTNHFEQTLKDNTETSAVVYNILQ
jgi:hypothetical protein